jgi:hypothetical protein
MLPGSPFMAGLATKAGGSQYSFPLCLQLEEMRTDFPDLLKEVVALRALWKLACGL